MRVAKNYLYNASYQIINLILPLVTAHYLSRALGEKAVGINAFTYSIVSYFLLLALLGIDVYGRKLIAEKRDSLKTRSESFWQIFYFHLVSTSIAIILYLIFVYFFGGDVKHYLYLQSIILVASIFDISWFFIGLEDFRKTVLRNIFVRLIMVAAIFIFIQSPKDLWLLIVLTGVTNLIGNLSLWPYLRNIISKPRLADFDFFRHIKPSLLLFIPNVATQIYLQFNKTLLGLLGDFNQVGLFNYPDQFTRITLALVTATGAVMLPNVAHKFAQGDHLGIISSLKKSMNFVIFLSILLAGGLFITAPAFFGWLLPPNFSPSIEILQVLTPILILIGISNVLGFQFMVPTNRTRPFTISVIVGAVVNLVVNILLIPNFQAIGTAIATVLAELAVLITQLILIRKEVDLKSLFSQSYKYLVAGLIMVVITIILPEISNSNLLQLVVQAVIATVIYLVVLFVLRAPIIVFTKDLIKNRK